MKDSIDMPVKSGFTLIELLITMTIAMVILGGLLLTFISQNKEYSYQTKRINAVLDLEFAMRFLGEDLRSGLMSTSGALTGNPSENNNFLGADKTGGFTFWVWDSVNGVISGRAQRKYALTGASLRYDNEASVTDDTANAVNIILENVTYFKIFADGVTSRAGYTGIPLELNTLDISDALGSSQVISGYTILIEIAVDAGYEGGNFLDVKGEDVRTTADPRKRVWRYIQEYPMTVVD